MGLRERFREARRSRTPPMRLDLSGTGAVGRSGASVRVVVTMDGADDGTARSIGVYLRLLGWDTVQATKWPLGELPATFGTQELEVQLPAGLPPSCARYTEYALCADLRRSEPRGITQAARIAVIARPEDLFWPAGERAGGAIAIEGPETIVLGDRVTGSVWAPGEVTLEIGPELDTLVGVRGKVGPRFQAAATVTLPAGEQRFDVDLPAAIPPTLYDGRETSIVWQIRARSGDATGTRTFGVLDPEGVAAARTAELLSFLARLARDRLF